MRSPIGPVLVLIGLATTVVLVLVLFQNFGLRSDLESVREELGVLRSEVEATESGVTDEELVGRLDELEAGIRDWLISTGADGGFDESPAGSAPPQDEVLDRLDEVLARINDLDARVDEICEGVPVC